MKKKLLFLFTALLTAVGTWAQDDDMLNTPLTLEAIKAGKVTFYNQAEGPVTYQVNGGETQTIESKATGKINLNVGDKVAFFGDNSSYSIYNAEYGEYDNYSNITCSADCYIYGNIMSLVTSTNFVTADKLEGYGAFYNLFSNNVHLKNHPSRQLVLPATTLAVGCYSQMFWGCTGLTKAPELPATRLVSKDKCYSYMFSGCTGLAEAPDLPATTLAWGCYSGMFSDCTGLTKAPELPAMTLADWCYESMFYGCTGLTKAPELPARNMKEYCYSGMFSCCTGLTKAPNLPSTTLAWGCYSHMFILCTGLTKAPELPAMELPDECYREMFWGCTNLNSVICLAPYNLIKYQTQNYSTKDWLYGVSTTGTFYKHPDMVSWPTGASGIPEGWTVVDYDMTGINATTADTKKADATTYDLRGMKSTTGKKGLKVVSGKKILTK